MCHLIASGVLLLFTQQWGSAEDC